MTEQNYSYKDKDIGNSRQYKINKFIIDTYQFCLRVDKNIIKRLHPQELRCALLMQLGIRSTDALLALIKCHPDEMPGLRIRAGRHNVVSSSNFVMIPSSLIMTLSNKHLWIIAYIQTSSWCDLSIDRVPMFGRRAIYYLMHDLPIFKIKKGVVWLDPELYIELIKLSKTSPDSVGKLIELNESKKGERDGIVEKFNEVDRLE